MSLLFLYYYIIIGEMHVNLLLLFEIKELFVTATSIKQ